MAGDAAHQRRDAVGVGEVEVRSGLLQHGQQAQMPRVRGEPESGATLGVARICRHALRQPVGELRQVPARRCGEKGDGGQFASQRAARRRGGGQPLDVFDEIQFRGGVQRRLARTITRIGFCPGAQQGLQRLGAGQPGGVVQGGQSTGIGGVDIGSRREQPVDQRQVRQRGREVQRGAAKVVGGIGRGFGRQQNFHRVGRV